MCKEDNDMSTVQDKKLIEANEKINSVIGDLWAKAERNLKNLEIEYNNKTKGGRKD